MHGRLPIFQTVKQSRTRPALPPERPSHFFATVHGTVFGDRFSRVDDVREGDELTLLPDPPVVDTPGVWVHGPAGDVIGHLPPEIGFWLAPWMLRGGSAKARAVRVSGEDVPSWRRVLLEIRCV